jgi:hypothetical protein
LTTCAVRQPQSWHSKIRISESLARCGERLTKRALPPQLSQRMGVMNLSSFTSTEFCPILPGPTFSSLSAKPANSPGLATLSDPRRITAKIRSENGQYKAAGSLFTAGSCQPNYAGNALRNATPNLRDNIRGKICNLRSAATSRGPPMWRRKQLGAQKVAR